MAQDKLSGGSKGMAGDIFMTAQKVLLPLAAAAYLAGCSTTRLTLGQEKRLAWHQEKYLEHKREKMHKRDSLTAADRVRLDSILQDHAAVTMLKQKIEEDARLLRREYLVSSLLRYQPALMDLWRHDADKKAHSYMTLTDTDYLSVFAASYADSMTPDEILAYDTTGIPFTGSSNARIMTFRKHRKEAIELMLKHDLFDTPLRHRAFALIMTHLAQNAQDSAAQDGAGKDTRSAAYLEDLLELCEQHKPLTLSDFLDRRSRTSLKTRYLSSAGGHSQRRNMADYRRYLIDTEKTLGRRIFSFLNENHARAYAKVLSVHKHNKGHDVPLNEDIKAAAHKIVAAYEYYQDQRARDGSSCSSKRPFCIEDVAHVTRGYRPPSDPRHNGIDYLDGDGKVYPMGRGTVVKSGYDTKIGHHVIIYHGDEGNHYSLYGHFRSSPFVHKGEQVTPNSLLGNMGSTGNATGPHVHLEIRVRGSQEKGFWNGTPIDPFLVVDGLDSRYANKKKR